MNRLFTGLLVLAATAASAQTPPRITVDYPAEGSIFPPEFPAPTFLWRDPAREATAWAIETRFGDDPTPLRARSAGEHLRIGRIDPRCASPTNQPPRLTSEQVAAHTWKPDAPTWAAIRQRGVEAPVKITTLPLPDWCREPSRE